MRDTSDGDDSSGNDSASQLADDRVADLSELLLTPVDILQMKLASVRVVVLGGCHSTGLGQVSPCVHYTSVLSISFELHDH